VWTDDQWLYIVSYTLLRKILNKGMGTSRWHDTVHRSFFWKLLSTSSSPSTSIVFLLQYVRYTQILEENNRAYILHTITNKFHNDDVPCDDRIQVLLYNITDNDGCHYSMTLFVVSITIIIRPRRRRRCRLFLMSSFWFRSEPHTAPYRTVPTIMSHPIVGSGYQ